MRELDHRLVVVLDDHHLSRRLTEHVLIEAGFEVRCAATISDARTLLAGRPPAAIVLDLQLPDGSGLELARTCRRDPRLRSCAILACTAGDSGDDDERRARRAGCDAYVSKPIDVHRFAELLRRLLAVRLGRENALRPAGSARAPGGQDGASR